MTPLGILAPISTYFLGYLRKSTISSSSSFSSARPATSLKVTRLGELGSVILARLFPKFIILELAAPPPPAACLFIMSVTIIMAAAMSKNGSMVVTKILSRTTSLTTSLIFPSAATRLVTSFTLVTLKRSELLPLSPVKVTLTVPVGTSAFWEISTFVTFPD